jgi:hypothetical protein
MDLYSTVLDMASIPAPKDVFLDGTSLTKVLFQSKEFDRLVHFEIICQHGLTLMFDADQFSIIAMMHSSK